MTGRRQKQSGLGTGLILGTGLSYAFSAICSVGVWKETVDDSRSLKEDVLELLEEESEIDPTTEATAVVCIIVLLIGLTIAFEEIKELIEESTSRDMRPIIESLFGEMTVLGFLSVCTFVITRTRFPYRLSEHLFGEEEFLVEIFEMVHFTLFFIMVFFVTQVLVLLGQRMEKTWLAMDRACQEIRHSSGEPHLHAKHRYSEEALDLFVRLQDEFILERDVEPPFAPAPPQNQVPDDFNFGRYLSICLGIEVSHVVHISISTWLGFIVVTLIFYVIVLLLETHLVVLAWIWAGIGWFAFLFLAVVFEPYLKGIAAKLAASEAAAHNGNHATEGDALLSDQLPAWCLIDLDAYLEKRSTFKKWLCPKTPTRHDTLFWFETRGPHLHSLILQANLVFLGIYGGLLILTFRPIIIAEHSTALAVSYFVVAALPIFGILWRIRSIVTILSIVGSIGSLRRPQVVSAVIRKEKTQLAVRAFLVLDKMHRLALQDNPEEPESETRHLTHFQAVEVGATFDAFDKSGDGSISVQELAYVLQCLASQHEEEHVSTAKVQRLLSTLDVNKDGLVSKAEFLEWYQIHMLGSEHVSLEERAHALFHMFDKNGSGEISIGEFKKTLDAFHIGFTVDEVGQIINELDEDGNIMIGQHEFHDLLEKYYPWELEEE